MAHKKLIFNTFQYASNHWACRMLTETDDQFIAFITKNNYRFLVKLNPTDSRGYRTIVQYCGQFQFDGTTDINNTFNRLYTVKEKTALFEVTSEVSEYYELLGLVTEIEYAGNNSHEFKNETLYLGKQDEPSMLHTHIICRGDPEHAYIGNVKLRGPIPHESFDMRKGKTEWENGEMKQISEKIRKMHHDSEDSKKQLSQFIRNLQQDAQTLINKQVIITFAKSVLLVGTLLTFSYTIYKSK
jgi:hypothetical protein